MLSVIQLAIFVCGGWLVPAAVVIGVNKSALQKGELTKKDLVSCTIFCLGAWTIFFQTQIAKFLMTLLP
jgi:hypothetical protein